MSDTALVTTESRAMVFGQQIGYTPEYVELIKHTYAQNATDNELTMFLEVCHQSKLNPFKKEIYFWKQRDNKSNTEKVIIHTGIDGYRLIADRTGRYAPGRPVKRGYDASNRHISSTAYVRKKVGTDWFEIEETAFMSEWSKNSPFWKDGKESHQLDITAERHALRKAFPSSFSGLSDSNPDGSAPIDVETTEQIAARAHLTEQLLAIGKLFTNEAQYAALEATVKTAPLPVLEERYSNALIKLKEFTLGKIGEKLQGEAFSAFIVKAFPSGLDAAEADEFFKAIDMLADVEPGEVVDNAAKPEPTPTTTPEPVAEPVEDPDAAAERAAMANEADAEPVSPEELELIGLREQIMDKIMTWAAGDEAKVDELLDGRQLNFMSKDQLERFLKTVNEQCPF